MYVCINVYMIIIVIYHVYVMCVYIYIYIYVYTVKSGGMGEVCLCEPKDIDEVSNRIPPVSHHRWNRHPRLRPQTFDRLVFIV